MNLSHSESRRADICIVVTGLLVLVLSLEEQSAARMLSWPWCILYGGVAVLPWLLLPTGGRMEVLPSLAWLTAVGGLGTGLIVSVALSPFRAELWVWLGVPLACLAWFLVLHGQLSRSPSRIGIAGWGPWLVGAGGSVLSAFSLLLWSGDQFVRLARAAEAGESLPSGVLEGVRWWFASRNHQPLGHVNYTGGSAVLFLPWLVWLAAKSWGWRYAGAAEIAGRMVPPLSSGRSLSSAFCRLLSAFWILSSVLCLLMLVSSGSRAAWLGLLVTGGATGLLLWRNRPGLRRWLVIVLLIGGGCFLLAAVFNPPLRAALRRHAPTESPSGSNAERREMVRLGWRMGVDRPVFGWGIGAVPLAYDEYRATAVYGPINMLQVHSTPVNLWAEGGAVLVLASAMVLLLALRELWLRSAPNGVNFADSAVLPAGVSLLAYAVFSLTDYQFDLPIIAFTVATNLAFLAAARPSPRLPRPLLRTVLACLALAGVVGMGTVGYRWVQSRRALDRGEIDGAIAWQPQDSTLRAMRGLAWAAMANRTDNERARALWRFQARTDLEQAAAAGAHDEFVHFNVGWLLLDTDPAAAAHFIAALRVAPSRENTWLGLGLARLRQGERDAAIDALAMECLVTPSFLAAGWWARADLAALRPETLRCLATKLERVHGRLVPGGWPEPQARYLRAVVGWMQGDVSAGVVSECADTVPNAEFWQALAVHEPLVRHPFFAAIRGDPAMAVRLCRSFAQAGAQLSPDEAVQQLHLLAQAGSAEDALRRLLLLTGPALPLPGGQFPLTAGFGVRMRNPYAQRLRFCGPEIGNPFAESLLPEFLPPAGWVYDDTVRGLIGPANRVVAIPLESGAERQIQ